MRQNWGEYSTPKVNDGIPDFYKSVSLSFIPATHREKRIYKENMVLIRSLSIVKFKGFEF